jgi:hypothetical protein
VIFGWLVSLKVDLVPLNTKEGTMSSMMSLAKVFLWVWSLLESIILKVSPPSIVDPTPVLAFFGLEGCHDHCLHSLIE